MQKEIGPNPIRMSVYENNLRILFTDPTMHIIISSAQDGVFVPWHQVHALNKLHSTVYRYV